MKEFKQIDWLISVLLIVIFLVMGFIHSIWFLYGYFIVGGWQVISMIVHELAGWFVIRGSLRRSYHVIVLVIMILGCSFIIYEPLAFISYLLCFIMLFAAPVMALFYTSLCYNEWKSLSRRPLSVLK
jgi:hypothetical protein